MAPGWQPCRPHAFQAGGNRPATDVLTRRPAGRLPCLTPSRPAARSLFTLKHVRKAILEPEDLNPASGSKPQRFRLGRGFVEAQEPGPGARRRRRSPRGKLRTRRDPSCSRDRTTEGIGTSTAVFGALGTLSALQVPRRRAWLTLGVGVALLGFLGTGSRADLLAHLFGFAAGVAEGLAVRRMTPPHARSASRPESRQDRAVGPVSPCASEGP
jgi:hypothetical protein